MDNGFHCIPLVPGCLKALQYVSPCAVGAAQCHLSNEVNSFGCAAQYNRRARADAQLRIDWKVRHGYLTPELRSKFHTLSLPKTFEPNSIAPPPWFRPARTDFKITGKLHEASQVLVFVRASRIRRRTAPRFFLPQEKVRDTSSQ